MAPKPLSFAITSFILLIAFYYRQPPTNPAKMSSNKNQVVFPQVILFGDSITQGAWQTEDGLGSFLQHVYQRKFDVLNRGLSGYNTKWALPVLKQWLPLKKGTNPPVKLMTIWFGANDACIPPSPQHLSLSEFKANLHEIVSLITKPDSEYHSPETKIVLITPPPINVAHRKAELESRDPPQVLDRTVENTREFAEAVKEVARESNVHVLDTWSLLVAKAGGEDNDAGLRALLRDGLHLTNEGYKIVSNGFEKLVKDEIPELHWDNLESPFPHWSALIKK